MFLMLWLTWKLLTFPLRVAFGAGRVTTGSIRIVGISRVALVALGAGIGLALAPTSGAEFRSAIMRRLQTKPGDAAELADRVRHELAHSPRTWHLPQPTVSVVDNRVVLTGAAPHATGREDLARIAAAVAGVAGVDNLLDVDSTSAKPS